MSDQTQEAVPNVVNVTDPNTVAREVPERGEGGKFKAKEAASEVETPAASETGQPATAEAPEKQVNKTTEYINRLKQREKEAQARAQEMERRFQELEARLPKQPEPKAPDPGQFFGNPAEWVQQNAQFYAQDAVAKARQEWEQQAAMRQQQEADQRALSAWDAKIEQMEATHPGVREALDSVPEEILTQEFARAIVAHERGVEVAYHLATNPGELYQVVSLPPQVISLAINHIASRLTATPAQAPNPAAVPPAKTVTRAPAPVTTLSGAPPAKKSYAQMSQKEYEAARRAERKAKGLRD